MYSFGRVGSVRVDRNPGNYRNHPLSEERIVGTDRLTMVAGPDETLEISGEGEIWFRVRPSGKSFRVEAPVKGQEVRLEPHGRSLRMVGADETEEEQGVWSVPVGAGNGIAGGSVLLRDGSLYRITDRAGGKPSYDLCGWRISCPYFSVSRKELVWEFRVHPAGASLLQDGRGVDLLIFFAVAVSGAWRRSGIFEEADS